MPPRTRGAKKVATQVASTARAAISKSKSKRKATSEVVVDSDDRKPRAKISKKTAAATETVVETAIETTTTKTDATKAAWGALLGGNTSKKVGGKTWVRPKPAGALDAALKAKIQAAPKVDGVTSTRTNNAPWKIVAWNVNGLRAVLKRDDTVHFRAYVAQEDPDILCLSETKIGGEDLQKLEDVLPQYEHQYWTCAAKKGYSGTVVFTKTKPLSVKDEIVVSGSKPDDEGRFLALEFDTFWLVHTYVPNAGQKLDRLDYRTSKWDKALLKMLQDLEKTKPVIWCGDLNVAHQEIDIHDPKGNRNKSPGFTDAERESFSNILASGFVDTFRHFYPERVQYTYFSYRFDARAKNKGWRLDYFVVSKSLLDRVESSFVRPALIGSDHVPIGLELK